MESQVDEEARGRMVSLIGDAEMDEGNITKPSERAENGLRKLWIVTTMPVLDAESQDREKSNSMFRKSAGTGDLKHEALRSRVKRARRSGDA